MKKLISAQQRFDDRYKEKLEKHGLKIGDIVTYVGRIVEIGGSNMWPSIGSGGGVIVYPSTKRDTIKPLNNKRLIEINNKLGQLQQEKDEIIKDLLQ